MRSRSMLALALLLPTLLVSQELPRPELGFRSGIIRRSEGGALGSTQATTTVVLPDGLFGSGGGLHYLMFFSPRFGFEPQVGLTRVSDGTDTFQWLILGAQASVFLGPDVTRAPYAFGLFRTMRQSSSGSFSNSETMNGMGLGLGYRRVIRESLSIRYEGRFLSWSGNGQDATEMALLISLGAVIRR